MLRIGPTTRHRLGLRRPRLKSFDLIRESTLAITRHPGRSILTAVGTVLGAAAYVCTMGLGSTLSQQVSTSFDIRRATEVVVRETENANPDGHWHTAEAVNRIRKLNGVANAGRRIILPELTIRRAITLNAQGTGLKVIGADPGALRAMAPRLVTGRLYDDFHDTRKTPVILLPKNAANRLGITRIGVAVFLGDQAFTVMGIYDDVARRPEALFAAIVPLGAAYPLQPADTRTVQLDVVIETVPGAAQLIGRQAPLALRPEAPATLTAIAPPDPRTLRREIEHNVAQASLLLSLVALTIGTISIAAAATAGIASRVAEIGLRRAIGARPSHIFAQLVAETTALGTAGGALGAALGIFAVAAISLWNGWAPVIDIGNATSAAAAGAAAGLLAGLVPAIRAIRIHPITALQR